MADVPARDMGTGSDDLMNHYLADVCEGGNQWSSPSLPCEIAAAIDYQCKTGLEFDTYNNRPDCYDTNTCQPYDFQRTCYCKSQFLDSSLGCAACYKKHGASMTYDWSALPSIMNDYCDPQASPTCFFEDYLGAVYTPTSSSSGDAYSSYSLATFGGPPRTSTKFSDPLGDSTDVSLYFTPSKTGLDAWQTTLSTINDWSGDAIQKAMAGNAASITQAAGLSTSGMTGTGTYLTVLTSGSTTMTMFTNETARPMKASGGGAVAVARVGVGSVLGVLGLMVVVLVL